MLWAGSAGHQSFAQSMLHFQIRPRLTALKYTERILLLITETLDLFILGASGWGWSMCVPVPVWSQSTASSPELLLSFCLGVWGTGRVRLGRIYTTGVILLASGSLHYFITAFIC